MYCYQIAFLKKPKFYKHKTIRPKISKGLKYFKKIHVDLITNGTH